MMSVLTRKRTSFPIFKFLFIFSIVLALHFEQCAVSASFFSDLSDVEYLEPEDDEVCEAKDSVFMVAMNTRFIDRAITALVPMLDEQLESCTIPPQEIPHGNTGEISIRNFFLDHLSISLASPKPDQFTVVISDLSFLIDESNFTITSGITCPGVFWGEIEHTSLTLIMKMGISESNRFSTEVINASFTWGTFSLHHKVSGTMCNIAESVVAAFLGDLDTYVEEKVKEELPQKLPDLLKEQFDELIDQLPFPVTGGPFLTDDSISFEMQLVDPKNLAPNVPSSHSGLLRQVQKLVKDKDFGMLLPARSVQNRLEFLHCRHILQVKEVLPSQWNSGMLRNVFPEAYHACQDCALEVSLIPQRSWTIETNAESLDFNFGGLEIGLFMITETQRQARQLHDHILSYEEELPLGRVWLTPDFTTSPPSEANTKIPVGKILVNGQVAVEEIYGGEMRPARVFFQVQMLDDLEIKILEMNVNGVTEKDIRRAILSTINFGVMNVNKLSPYNLPPYTADSALELNQEYATLALNIKMNKLIDEWKKRSMSKGSRIQAE